MEMHRSKNLISYAVALLMLLLFALAVVSTVLYGARAFRKMKTDMEQSFHAQTASTYIAAKLRYADVHDAVFCSDVEGIAALGIRENIDGESYITYIYVHNGWLTELYCLSSANLSADAGEKVIPLDAFTFEIVDRSVRYTCVKDGQSRYSRIALRAAGR